MPLPEVGSGAEPLTPVQIKQRLTRVDLLIGLGETEGAYLSLWSLLEALPKLLRIVDELATGWWPE